VCAPQLTVQRSFARRRSHRHSLEGGFGACVHIGQLARFVRLCRVQRGKAGKIGLQRMP
jgi:hypothetical protein